MKDSVMSSGAITETVTLSQARELIRCLSHEQSVLLLSPPGVGKSDIVRQAAREANLECKSLLGTQIAPEDVSGVPRIIGERSVFCPPRVLLPENATKFCLFLDELPACAPDVQKAFYSLLLERRIGEYSLPEGTWVVAAGNRAEDKALVRTISSALVNRVLILNVRIDVSEWVQWAQQNTIRKDIISFVEQSPESLLRPVPDKPVPFSTPRAWASLSRALDLVGQRGQLTASLVRALAVGRVSEDDARRFAAAWLGTPAESTSLEEKLAWPLAKLELSIRATNCLESEGICVIRDLVVRLDDELMEIRNFGEGTLREVKAKLALHGLSLGMTL
jgi:MoxR-like ATPase